MSSLSWFGSPDHLEAATFWFDVAGALIEFGVAITAAIIVHEEFGKEREKQLERCVAIFAGIAAFLVLFTAILNHQVSTLRERETEQGKRQQNVELAESSNRWAVAESKVQELRTALLPRRITSLQRETFIKVLNDPNNVCKSHIRVFVGKTDQETEHFANDFRKMLNGAGYGTSNEGVEMIPDFSVQPSGAYDQKLNPIIALFSSPNNEIPAVPTNHFQWTVSVFYPTEHAGTTNAFFVYSDEDQQLVSRDLDHVGRLSGTLQYHPVRDPNDILRGVSSVLQFIGIEPGMVSGHSVLKPGEIAFFIPQRIY